MINSAMSKPDIAKTRREYDSQALLKAGAQSSPIVQFLDWYHYASENIKLDPNAMLLSTVDSKGFPDSRIVLLKGVDESGFVFFSNYDSAKGKQLAIQPVAALTFYWPELCRQVRVRGETRKISAQASDEYFSSRPRNSQISAIVSKQSQVVHSRAELEEQFKQCLHAHRDGQPLKRPVNWGGYQLTPFEIEFWQGRTDRLHDRLLYRKCSERQWKVQRLSP